MIACAGKISSVLIAALLLSGCSLWLREETYLPPLSSIECCWQSEEQVTLKGPVENLTLLSITARTQDQLSLVILDPMGRPLLSLVYQQGKLQTLTSPPGWDPQLSEGILTALFLHHSRSRQWPGDWRVDEQEDYINLIRGQETFVTIRYSNNDHSHRQVSFTATDAHLEVITLKTTPLPP